MAMEMAGNPSVLFLDQPFVGMDLPQMINFARILKVRCCPPGGIAHLLPAPNDQLSTHTTRVYLDTPWWIAPQPPAPVSVRIPC